MARRGRVQLSERTERLWRDGASPPSLSAPGPSNSRATGPGADPRSGPLAPSSPSGPPFAPAVQAPPPCPPGSRLPSTPPAASPGCPISPGSESEPVLEVRSEEHTSELQSPYDL